MRRVLLALLLLLTLCAASRLCGEVYVRGSDWGSSAGSEQAGGIGGILYSLPASGNATTANYYHYDGRGDVVAQTSGASGNVVYQAAYNAYGEHTPGGTGIVPIAPGTQEWSANGTVTEDLRANTKEEDPTGLLWVDQRYLNIATNTWMAGDPAGMVDTPNLYSYCRDNPTTFFDPNGLETIAGYISDESNAEWDFQGQKKNLDNAYRLSTDKQGFDYQGRLNQILNDKDAKITKDEQGIADIREMAGKAGKDPATFDDDGYTTQDLIDPDALGASARHAYGNQHAKEVANAAVTIATAPDGGELMEGAEIAGKLIAKDGAEDVAADAGQLHHIATDKNLVSTAAGGPYTPAFKEMFAKAGMSLQDDENIVRVLDHSGPHPEYNQQVFQRLNAAVRGLSGDAYKQALQSQLKVLGEESTTPGTPLNKLLTSR